MEDSSDLAVAVLDRAMAIERQGHGFYLWAAGEAGDERARQTLLNLADDEERHFQLIRKQRESLSDSGRWLDLPEVKPAGVDLDRPLFPQSMEERAGIMKDAYDEAGALLFGLGIESKSLYLYRSAAEQTGDPLGKSVFEFLAGEEAAHFDILMMRYEAGFGPADWSA